MQKLVRECLRLQWYVKDEKILSQLITV